jgi:polyphenol oxidase
MTSRPSSGLWLKAEWPVPARIQAGCTALHLGFFSPPYTGLSLAGHVGDEQETVERNRRLLESELELTRAPLWLEQVHGDRIIDSDDWFAGIHADACTTSDGDVVCAILSADCLPLLLCNEEGLPVAAVHLGWRGICSTLLDQAISSFGPRTEGLRAWIGPHIHSEHYEVGEEVRETCEQAISARIMLSLLVLRENGA